MPSKRRPAQIDESKVEEYTARLDVPSLDRLGYVSILSELRADKKVRGAELGVIC